MSKEKMTNLIPTQNEIKEILSQVFQAQAEKHFGNIKDLPVVILQAWVNQVVLKAFNKTRDELYKSSGEFLAELNKTIKRLEDSIDNK